MITNFIHTHLVKHYGAMHVHRTKEHVYYHVLVIHKNKNKLQIVEEQLYNSLEEVIKNVNKNIPYIVSFTGGKIISKTVKNETNYLEKLLFNQNLEDFYWFETGNEKIKYVSLSRKKDIDAELEKLNKETIQVIDFYLGYGILEKIKAVVANVSSIRVPYGIYNTTTFSFNEQQQNEYSNMQIGDEVIAYQAITPFAGILNFFSNSSINSNYGALVSSKAEDFYYKKGTATATIFTVILFLMLLLTSYFTGGIYADKNAAIQNELMVKNQFLNEIEVLKKDVTYKQNIINNSSLGAASYLSYYLQEIGANVPTEIILDKLQIFPFQEPIKADKAIDIQPNFIAINGYTYKESALNKWIVFLDQLFWVKKVEIVGYAYKKDKYVFTINIDL